MKKPQIILLTAAALTLFSALFLYLDYKRNPINYIILSKKLEIVSYLFFRDLPAKFPTTNYYYISYKRIYAGEKAGGSFDKSMGAVTIYDPKDVYATGLPQKLRKIFDDYARLDPNKREDQKITEDVVGTNNAKGRIANMIYIFHGVAHYDEDLQKRIKEYIKLFSKKFIVTSITEYKDDEQCGQKSYDMTIIFNSNPTEDLTIGLTNSGKVCFIWDEIGLSEYQIRDIKLSKEYRNYWL